MCPDVPSRKGLNGLVVSGCNMQVLAWGAEEACRLPGQLIIPVPARQLFSEKSPVRGQLLRLFTAWTCALLRKARSRLAFGEQSLKPPSVAGCQTAETSFPNNALL